jgi:DNA mismatch repair protein PMS2
MSNSIQSIDKLTIQRICSGQVVVDLATAIKELVENSLDSGATSIEIKLKEMGLTSIEVSDNGSGIDPCNYNNIALKHHTSKLQEFSDLASVNSFGFRGEALNALCALSGNFTIVTKQSTQIIGSLLNFARDGKLISTKSIARSPGTTVTVDNLFEILPVRRGEFIRSIKKQYQKLIRILHSYAIISSGIKILVVNFTKGVKSIVIGTQANNKINDNISSVFGSKFLSTLVPLSININVNDDNINNNNNNNNNDIINNNNDNYSEELNNSSDSIDIINDIKETNNTSISLINEDCSIQGYISNTNVGVGRSDNDRQFLFCNGRPVDLPKFSKVINEVWRRYEMKNKPACILNILVPSGSFDVNLTPDKREIVLSHENILLEKLRDEIDKLYSPSRYTFQLSQGNSRGTQQDLFSYSFCGSTPVNNINEEKNISIQENNITKDIVWRNENEENNRNDQINLKNNLIKYSDEIIGNKCNESTLEDGVILNDNKQNINDMNIILLQKNDDIENDNAKNITNKRRKQNEKEEEKEEIKINNMQVNAPSNLSVLTSNKSNNTWKFDASETLNKYKSKSNSKKNANSNIVNEEKKILIKECSIEGNENNINNNNGSTERALARVLNKTDFIRMKILGQFNLGFIIVELDNDLYILDQHACDEKYKFEKLQHDTKIHQQPLIVPLVLEATAAEELIIIENLSTFEANGFKLLIDDNNENKNNHSRIKILAVPFSKHIQFGENDVHELASILSENISGNNSIFVSKLLLKNDILPTNNNNNTKLNDVNIKKVIRLPKLLSMFASRSCRSAVMIGTCLNYNDMKSIVNNLSTIEQPWNCPHGRPTMRHLVDLLSLKRKRNEYDKK